LTLYGIAAVRNTGAHEALHNRYFIRGCLYLFLLAGIVQGLGNYGFNTPVI
jgi:hypothetical protein